MINDLLIRLCTLYLFTILTILIIISQPICLKKLVKQFCTIKQVRVIR